MIIELLDGTEIDIENHSLRRLFHHIPSANIEHTTSTVDGRGEIITHSMLSNRTISVEFLFKTQDIRDYYMLRDEINGLMARTEPFYIKFKRERYKRWKVKLANGFQMPPKPHMGTFTVDFITVDKYAESVGTSLQLAQYNFDSDLWGFGSNIDVDQTYQYKFSENQFVIQNIGNVNIDPRESNLEIIVKANAASFLRITNWWTGDVYEYHGTLTSTDTLVLTGIRSLKNGMSVFGDTNGNLITVRAGHNYFTVEGGNVIDIQFNFRFLYK